MNQPNDTPEPSLASAGSLPEAWAVEWKGDTKIDRSTVCCTEDAARRKADECPALGGVAVPLYRQPHPTLTDEEREALAYFSTFCDENVVPEIWIQHAASLRGLLERTK